MKARYAGVLILLFAALLLPPATAAGVKITSDQTEYYFALGQIAQLSLPVSNTYSSPIEGTLRFTTIQQLQNAGNTLTITKNQIYPTAFPAGNSFLNVSAGTSNVSQTIKIQIAYQYTDSAPVLITLPEIRIHFVQDLSQYTNQSSIPVSSTSGAGLPGGLGNSSVQLAQQAVSAQQQAGVDTGSTSLQSSASSSQNGQMFQNTSVLKAQIQQAAAQMDAARNTFNQALAADPLLRQVNKTLTVDGFFRQSVTTNPSSGDNGTFAMIYQDRTGEQVNLQGALINGTVYSVLEQSAAALNVTTSLGTNATYQSFTNDLIHSEFQRNRTLMNVTLTGTTVNVTYLSRQGARAYIHAKIDNGNVTLVSLDRESTDITSLLLGIICAIFIAVGAGMMYRHVKVQKKVASAAFPRQSAVPPDYQSEVLSLLAEAEAAFANRNYKNAYGFVGQATRVYFSCEQGERRELTNGELVHLLAASRHAKDLADIIALLERCSDVEFAKGMPDTDEFAAMIRQVRAFVSPDLLQPGIKSR